MPRYKIGNRDVFRENDPVRRRAAINEIFHEDGVFYEPRCSSLIDKTHGYLKGNPP
jgi:hypothetical protein